MFEDKDKILVVGKSPCLVAGTTARNKTFPTLLTAVPCAAYGPTMLASSSQYCFYTCAVDSSEHSSMADQQQTTYESSWNEAFTFVCDADKVMKGFSATTNKMCKDRHIQATCSKYHGLTPKLQACKGLTPKLPTKGLYDSKVEHNLDYTYPSGTVLTGVHSVFEEEMSWRPKGEEYSDCKVQLSLLSLDQRQ